jgi:tetratricopeptide (TPR) repeat protein
VSANEREAEALFTRAVAHHQKGELAEARAAYQQVLARAPTHADSLHYLGMLRFQAGDLSVALPLVEKSIALKPREGPFRTNLGILLAAMGRVSEAIAAYRYAIALAPGTPEPLYNLGRAYEQVGQPELAITAYRQAVGLQPLFAKAWGNLGVVLRNQGRWQEAVAACREALRVQPDLLGAPANLANALSDCGEFGEAIALYHDALKVAPEHAETWSNLGLALRSAGKLGDALATCQRAAALRPKNPLVHWNLAHVLLLMGQYVEGWAEYEWRWQVPEFPSPRRKFTPPQWRGEALAGRTILLHAEQGFGDTIQFVRYASLAAQQGGRVVLECPATLVRLLESVPGVAQVVATGTTLPSFDLHAPLLSLPHVFGTTLTTIPAAIPYLRAPSDSAARWAARLGKAKALRIGITWAGNPGQKYAAQKSVPAAALASLAMRDNIQLFSLQVGPASADLATYPAGRLVNDLAPELTDFAETAAAIGQLDLVICADTVVAHLAGALGKPAWVMLQAVPDWRWLMGRDDSPYYPGMRLFRQTTHGDWAGVVSQVEAALDSLRAA